MRHRCTWALVAAVLILWDITTRVCTFRSLAWARTNKVRGKCFTDIRDKFHFGFYGLQTHVISFLKIIYYFINECNIDIGCCSAFKLLKALVQALVFFKQDFHVRTDVIETSLGVVTEFAYRLRYLEVHPLLRLNSVFRVRQVAT